MDWVPKRTRPERQGWLVFEAPEFRRVPGVKLLRWRDRCALSGPPKLPAAGWRAGCRALRWSTRESPTHAMAAPPAQALRVAWHAQPIARSAEQQQRQVRSC